MGMFDYEKIRNEVEDYLGTFVGHYDVDAIMDDLRDYKWDGMPAIDDARYNDYLAIIESHEIAMFDYEKFIQTYATTADYKNFVAWFLCPNEKGVWWPMTVGPITLDGIKELLAQDAAGHIADIQIRHW